jgi:hypothetical protein
VQREWKTAELCRQRAGLSFGPGAVARQVQERFAAGHLVE